MRESDVLVIYTSTYLGLEQYQAYQQYQAI